MKITYQNSGTVWKVWLKGDTHEETEQRHWSFYNHKGTDTQELNWEGDKVGWFWSNADKLLKGMEGAALFELLNTRDAEFKGKKGGALAAARKAAKERFDEIESEPIYNGTWENTQTFVYSIGKVSAERPDECLRDLFVSRGLAG